ncbi:MAG: DUF2764 family protein [Paludibacteraceae bacterium]|nr:DUF2764 family protein [Paludibacteraceae bacterium]
MGYECLLAGLPDLKAGTPSPIPADDLLTLLDESLRESDKPLLDQLRMTPDSENISELYQRYQNPDTNDMDKPSWWDDAASVLTEADLRAAILYDLGQHAKNRFVRAWYAFNQDMNNVLVASICRKHGFDVHKAIVGHNEVSNILRKNTQQKDFGLGGVMDNLQDILDLAAIDNLMEREKKMDALRFAWLEDKTRFFVFSIELVLAYYLEATMLDRWSRLTVEQGEQVFRDMVADMKKGIQL